MVVVVVVVVVVAAAAAAAVVIVVKGRSTTNPPQYRHIMFLYTVFLTLLGTGTLCGIRAIVITESYICNYFHGLTSNFAGS